MQETVQTKDGVDKTVVVPVGENAGKELKESTKLAKGDEAPKQLDINNPKDGNKVVSPDNTHTLEGVGGVSVTGVPEQR
jgi:hypothetical protein